MTRILVAEDEKQIRALLVDTLVDAGYEVIASEDGSAALENARDSRPDLILLDVMMPVMDGFAVLEGLRESPLTENIPVVMLTALPASEGEHEALQMGVKHYLSKPWEPEELELTIKVALREGQSAAEEGGEELPRVIRIGDELIPLEKKLGGGLLLESLTLVEGAATAGKSVLCQHFAFGALCDEHKVAFFTSEHDAKSFATQMNSIGLDVSKYAKEDKLSLFPVQNPSTGEDSGPLLAAMALDLGYVAVDHKFIVVDCITDLAASSQGQSLIGFFASCKRICDQGATIVVVSQSYAFDSNTITRLRSLCNAQLTLRVGKVRDKLVRMIEIVKVNNMDLDRDNVVSFSVEPKVGIRIIPYSQARV